MYIAYYRPILKLKALNLKEYRPNRHFILFHMQR